MENSNFRGRNLNRRNHPYDPQKWQLGNFLGVSKFPPNQKEISNRVDKVKVAPIRKINDVTQKSQTAEKKPSFMWR